MGSFDGTCSISGQPIRRGNRIVMYLIKKNQETFLSSFLYPSSMYSFASFPMRGEYNDYGFIENIDKDENWINNKYFYGFVSEKDMTDKVIDAKQFYDNRADGEKCVRPMMILEEVFDYLVNQHLKDITKRGDEFLKEARKLFKQINKMPIPDYIQTRAERREDKPEHIRKDANRIYREEILKGYHRDYPKELETVWQSPVTIFRGENDHFMNRRVLTEMMFMTWKMKNPLGDKNVLSWINGLNQNYALYRAMDWLSKVIMPDAPSTSYFSKICKHRIQFNEWNTELLKKRLNKYEEDYGYDEE